jgi:hypothetical protein
MPAIASGRVQRSQCVLLFPSIWARASMHPGAASHFLCPTIIFHTAPASFARLFLPLHLDRTGLTPPARTDPRRERAHQHRCARALLRRVPASLWGDRKGAGRGRGCVRRPSIARSAFFNKPSASPPVPPTKPDPYHTYLASAMIALAPPPGADAETWALGQLDPLVNGTLDTIAWARRRVPARPIIA